MQAIEQRTFALTRHLLVAMAKLRHQSRGDAEEVPLCTIYGRHFEEGVSSKTQGMCCCTGSIIVWQSVDLMDECDVLVPTTGAVIAFSLRWADGSPIAFSEVGRLAAERNIQLRTGRMF